MPNPELKRAVEVLNEPDKPEHREALKQYIEAKRPAEALRLRQREWMRQVHGE